jgi:hypothetical protein
MKTQQTYYLVKLRDGREEPFIAKRSNLLNTELSDLVCDYNGVKTWIEFMREETPIGETFVTDLFIIEKLKTL